MGEIIIGNLDDSFVRKLKQRAEQQRLTPEETARRMLVEALLVLPDLVRMSKEELAQDLRRIREMNPPITEPPFSEDFIREDRDSR